jgi:hypothetical protein
MGVIVWMDKCETAVKENNNSGWSSDGMVLWLWRRQNRDVVEWWENWSRLRWPFIAVESESWVVRGGWTTAVVRIQCLSFSSRGEERCQNMKRRQRARLGSMRRNCDVVQQRDNVSWRRCGTEEGKGRRWHQLGWRESSLGRQIKKIYAIDSTAING